MTLESVSLRPVKATDFDFLYQLYASTRAQELAIVPWSPTEKDAFLRQQFEAQHRHYQTAYPDGQFSVVRADKQDIGRLYVWRGSEELRIIDIALQPEWCRQGIGTQLIRRVLDEAASNGWRVTIHVELKSPAKRLYERLGFKPVSDNGIHRLLAWTAMS